MELKMSFYPKDSAVPTAAVCVDGNKNSLTTFYNTLLDDLE